MGAATRTAGQKRRLISMRLIVTAAATVLISVAVIVVGSIAERNARRTLLEEMETRLALEARNLALVSSRAFLTDFPELTLHPFVKKMMSERPGLALAYVVDRKGIVQGHADASVLQTPARRDPGLMVMRPLTALSDNETLLGNDELLVVNVPVLHSDGQVLGQAIVGLRRSYVEAALISARKQQLIVLASVLSVSILVTLVLMSVLLRPISSIRSALERIGRGDLDTRVDVRSNTELTLVAQSINDMTHRLRSAQRELLEKERLAHEMTLATSIQRSLLPVGPMRVGDFIIAGSQKAAAEVGGDFYDFFPLDRGRFGVVIADVAGKGLGGCMVASMLAVLIGTLRESRTSPSELIVAVQDALASSLQPGTFITIFYGILDASSGQLVFASAAHNPILHYQAATGRISWHRSQGIPVGLVGGNALRETLADHTLRLEPGDFVLETTDGFNEAVDRSMTEYGFERIEETVASVAHLGYAAVMDALERSVSGWQGPRSPADDQTLVVVGRAASGQSRPQAGDGRKTRVEALWKQREGSDHFSVPARLKSIDALGAWLNQCRSLSTWGRERLLLIEHGLYEMLSNIAEHGCGLDETKIIDLWWIFDPDSPYGDRGVFLIRDHGLPPAPESWRPPDAIQKRRQQGRGYGLEIIEKALPAPEFYPGTRVGNVIVIEVSRDGVPRDAEAWQRDYLTRRARGGIATTSS